MHSLFCIVVVQATISDRLWSCLTLGGEVLPDANTSHTLKHPYFIYVIPYSGDLEFTHGTVGDATSTYTSVKPMDVLLGLETYVRDTDTADPDSIHTLEKLKGAQPC